MGYITYCYFIIINGPIIANYYIFQFPKFADFSSTVLSVLVDQQWTFPAQILWNWRGMTKATWWDKFKEEQILLLLR